MAAKKYAKPESAAIIVWLQQEHNRRKRKSDSDDSPAYLFARGVPQNSSFKRIGPVSAIDEAGNILTFVEDAPPVVDGQYLSIGRRTNQVPYTDFSAALWQKTEVTLSFAEDYTEVSKTGANAQLVYNNILDATYGREVWVKAADSGNIGKNVSVAQSYSDGIYTTLTGDWQVVFCPPGAALSGETNFYALDFRGTSTATKVLVKYPFASQVDYTIAPFVIPTSGSPVTIDTSAADIATLHGLTWNRADNQKAFDVMDGIADGENVLGPSVLVDAIWTDNLDGTYTISSQGIGGINLVLPPMTISDRYELENEVVTIAEGSTRTSTTTGNFNNIKEIDAAGVNISRETVTQDAGLIRYYTQTFVGTFKPISVRKVSPANGIITLTGLTIVPDYDEWEAASGSTPKIMSVNNNTDILYTDPLTGFLYTSDGVNTCESAVQYVAGTKHNVKILLSADGFMRIDADGVKGTAVPFKGTLIDGDDVLKWCLGNEDLIKIDTVSTKQGLLTMPEDAV